MSAFYLTIAVGLIALAAAIRLPNLGFKPLMHDESLFAYYSHYLWTVGAMDYDPVLHGPFQLEVNACVFATFGDSDTTLRLFSAMCGIGVVSLILFGRPFRSGWGNLAAAFFTAVSPTLCYYSRFCRNDVPFSFFSVLWVAGCAAYWRTGRARWGVTAILAFATLLCIKENVVFLMATSVAFGAVLIATDLVAGAAAPKTQRTQSAQRPTEAKDGWFSQRASESSESSMLRGASTDTTEDAQAADSRSLAQWFLVFNNVALVLMLIVYLLLRRVAFVAASPPWALFAAIVVGAPCLSLPVALLVHAVQTGAGAEGLAQRIALRLWRDRYLLGAAAAGGAILFLMVYNYWQIGRFSPFGLARQLVGWAASGFTTPIQWLKPPEWTNQAGTLGFTDIINKAVSYWWGQHAEHRLRGPYHYYVPILMVYEWPLMIVVAIGSLQRLLCSKARRIATLLAFMGAIVLARLAPFVMPPAVLDKHLHIQSAAHLAATLLLAALTFVLAVAELLARRRARAFLIFWTATALVQYSYAGEKVPWLAVHIVLPLALLAGEYSAAFARWLRGWLQPAVRSAGFQPVSDCETKESIIRAESPHSKRRLALALVGALATGVLAAPALLKWSTDTGQLLANGADPVERMVYNHTTIQAKALAEEILALRDRRHTQNRLFHLTMAGEGNWPMLWYLRRIDRAEIDASDNLSTATADIIICDPDLLDRYPNVAREYSTRTIPLREAWVPPTISIGRWFMEGADRETWTPYQPVNEPRETEWLWRYWLDRELFPPPEEGGAASGNGASGQDGLNGQNGPGGTTEPAAPLLATNTVFAARIPPPHDSAVKGP